MNDAPLSEAGERPRLGTLIREQQDRILFLWQAAVRARGGACARTRPGHAEWLEGLLAHLADAADGAPLDVAALEGLSAAHALARLEAGAAAHEVVEELTSLRVSVLRLYGQLHGPTLPLAQVERLDQAVDAVLSASVASFQHARERLALAQAGAAHAAAERKAAELEATLQSLPDGFFLGGASGFSLVSARGLEQLGYDTPEQLARDLPTLVRELQVRDTDGRRPLSRDELPFFAALHGERTTREVCVRHRKTRQDVVLRVTTVPVRIQGRVVGAAAVTTDITERRQLEARQAALVESGLLIAETPDVEERVRMLARIVAARLADFCTVDVLDSEGTLRRFGLAHTPVLPELEARIGRIQAFAPIPTSASPVSRVFRTQAPLLLEEVTPDALDSIATSAEHRAILESLPIRSLIIVPLQARGRTLGVITLVSLRRRFGPRDLETARVVANRAALILDNTRLYERLSASEARLQAIIDNSVAPIFVKDARGRYLLVNRALEAHLGLPREAVLGRTDFELLPEETARALREADEEVLRTQHPVQREEVIPGPGGARTYLGMRSPLPGSEGRAPDICGVSTDITELKRAEEELRRTAELRERMIGIVSHDLRTPLSAMSLSAQALLRREELPARAVQAVRRIQSNAEGMARMVEDLLDLTRGSLGGGIPITRVPVDLADSLQQVLREFELTHPGRQLRQHRRGNPQGAWDEGRMHQVVSNLVKNALTYGPEDTPVDVVLEDQGAWVQVEVRNQGAPIPAELLPQLFQPFRRGQGSERRAQRGLGLGLYIVREIVTAHRGTVTVHSSEEEGTTFTLRLPREAPSEERPAFPRTSPPPQRHA